MMHKNNINCFTNPLQYVKNQYKKNITDEFIQPAYNQIAKDTMLSQNDWCFFVNFRPDRARQLCHLLKKSNLYNYSSPL